MNSTKNCVCHTVVKLNHDVNVIWFDRVSLNVARIRQTPIASPKQKKTKTKTNEARARWPDVPFITAYFMSIDGPVAWNNNSSHLGKHIQFNRTHSTTNGFSNVQKKKKTNILFRLLISFQAYEFFVNCNSLFTSQLRTVATHNQWWNPHLTLFCA